MKMMNPSKTITLAGVLLGMSMAGSVFAQDPVSVSLSDETTAADGTVVVALDFQGNGESQGFQCDINYDSTGIADIDLSGCLGGQFGTCVFPGGGDASGGVIRFSAANVDSTPLDTISGELSVTLDGTPADGDSIAFEWGGTCIATDPDAEVTTTNGSVTVGGGTCSLSISPASHDFGVLVPGNSASQPFTITNGGDADCTGLAVAVSGDPEFSLDGTNCGATLAAGASCDADASFSPASEGDFTGTLDATADNGSAAAALSGTGDVDGNDGNDGNDGGAVAIPTMQAWGLALTAMLMLLIGAVGMRTFRS